MYGNHNTQVELPPIDSPSHCLVETLLLSTYEVAEVFSTGMETAKQPGRKKSSDSQLLRNFFRQRKERPVKKEYVRAKIIRGHKRFFRYYNCTAIKHEIQELGRHRKGRCLKALADLYRVYNRKFVSMSRANTGLHKCYSNSFCLEYFSHEKVRESYFYYTEYLFTPLEPESLSRYFGMSCCTERFHFDECRRKWIQLKKVLQVTYIEELGYSSFSDHQLPEETEDCVLDWWFPMTPII